MMGIDDFDGGYIDKQTWGFTRPGKPTKNDGQIHHF